MDIGPDGSLFILDGNQIKVVQSVLPGPSDSDIQITSKSGQEIYVFSKEGRHLKTLSTRTGNPLWTFEYSNDGLLTGMKNGDGLNTQLVRSSDGTVESIVSPYGHVTKLTYNSEGYLSSLANPLGQVYSMDYLAEGLLAKFTKPNGAASTFSYDELGHLTRDQNAKGGFTELLKTLTNSTTRISSSTGISNAEVSNNSKTGFGDETVIVTSAANLNTRHDIFDNTIAHRYPYVTVSQYLVADPYFGGLNSYVSQNLDSFWGSYSQSVSYQKTGSDQFSYIKTTDYAPPYLGYYKAIYDSKNLTETIVSPKGIQTNITYDSQARPLQIANGDLEPLGFTYNSSGQLTKVTQGGRVTSYEYTKGQITAVRSPAGLTTQREYDDANHLIAETSPDGKVTRFDYDLNGNLTGITPPGKARHVFGFDVLDLLSSYLPPLVGGAETKTQYSYDLENKLKEILRPNGQKISYLYDTGGRLNKITTSEGDYIFAYDATTGLPSSYSSPDGVVTTISRVMNYFNFTITGPVNLKYIVSDQAINGVMQPTYYSVNGYNDYGQWSLDQDGLKYYESGTAYITRSTTNRLPLTLEMSMVKQNFAYNNFGEVTQKQARLYNNASAFLSLSYQRDSLGRVTNKSVVNQGVSSEFVYEYDLSGRLTKVTKDGNGFEAYSYDDNGNRTQSVVAGSASTSTYDSQDRLLSFGDKNYSYNANGELISVAGSGLTKTYSYNSFGYLKKAQVNGKTVDYILDANNNRVGRKVDGVLTQSFVYSNQGQIIGQLNNLTGEYRVFVYGLQENSPDAMKIGTTPYIFINDNNGSVRMVVNTSTGEIVQELDYDSFGNVIKDTNPGFQPFGFAGGLYDTDTKLVRFGAREYDPETGRWTSKDPIGFGGGDTNLFSYVANDPINFVDPMGLARCTYSISTGQLSCTSNDGSSTGSANMFSGDNNPASTGYKFGPIPMGKYDITKLPGANPRDWFLDPGLLSRIGYRLKVNRGGFNLHLRKGGSEGCITGDRGENDNNFNNINNILNQDAGSNTLEVGF